MYYMLYVIVGTLASCSENTVVLSGDSWWPQITKEEGDKTSKLFFPCDAWHGRSVMSAQMSEVSLVGVGTVLRLERDAWSMVRPLQ